jgi:putative ABC transport system permease protein
VILKYAPLLLANLRRHLLRTAFTLGSIIVAFLMFGLLEAMRNAFDAGATIAGQDRLLTLHKVSIVQPLPESYGNQIRRVDGVALVSSATWFGGTYQEDRNVIPVFPVDGANYLDIYPEIQLGPGVRERWLEEKRGALVGRAMSDRYALRPGQTIPLQSSIWRRSDGSNTWDVVVTGIYDIQEDKGDTMAILMHHEYFSEPLGSGKGLVGWYVVKVRDPSRAARVARAIDEGFANSPYETSTSTEKALAQSFANQIGNVGKILTGVVAAVFFTMLLVTANTMAQSVRERTSELAVLKTLGFTGTGVTALVLAEALMLTLLGGIAGMALAYVAVEVLGATARQYLPVFYIPQQATLLAVLLMIALGLAAGFLPARQATRLRIVEALRGT